MKKDILEIQIARDGDQWCALVGKDLQEGIAGFGDTPVNAIRALCDEFEKTSWNIINIKQQIMKGE